MCGLAGIFHQNKKAVQKETVQAMTDRIAHRGPDAQGFFVKDQIGLGHRRLSILDLSENGAQPMFSKDEQWVIVFNGCIYNFRELREELMAKGHHFVSDCDTEVIVEGLAQYGERFFERLNGMFAVVAYHIQTETVYLSRDRFGVKPLYYWFKNNKIVFSSEIKAILEHPEYTTAVNIKALNQYFSFQNLFNYETLFEGIHMVPPANTLVITKDTKKITHNAWWDYDFSSPDESMSFETARDTTEQLMRQAVKRQMIADVPVGSYLSGGMDSGSITALASTHVDGLCSFTAGFETSDMNNREAHFDERKPAEMMSNHFQTQQYQQVINSGDLKKVLHDVVWHLEDLKVGMSYPNFYVSRLASKFVKVCLSGTGGDELFGGYPWRYYRVFKSLDQKEFFENYYDFWQRLVPDEEKKELFQPNIFSKIDLEEPRRVFEKVFTFNTKLKYDTPEDHIQNSLYFEAKTFLPSLLTVGDKLAMAHALEERFPFLDNDLVDFAQKVPVKHKLGDLEEMKRFDENTVGNKKETYRTFSDGKNVLRKAMEHILPQEIIDRKKQGFSAPDESWYRGANAEYIQELLLGEDAASREYIQPEYIQKILDQHNNQNMNHRLLIWSFLCFEWWCRIFLRGESVESLSS